MQTAMRGIEDSLLLTLSIAPCSGSTSIANPKNKTAEKEWSLRWQALFRLTLGCGAGELFETGVIAEAVEHWIEAEKLRSKRHA